MTQNINNFNYNQENLLGPIDRNNDENKIVTQDNRNNNITSNRNVVNNNYINIVENINEIEEYYNKEPVNYDIISEYCSHILFAEMRKPRLFYGNFAEEDFIEQGIFRVIKSNHTPKKFCFSLNLERIIFSLIIKEIIFIFFI